MSETVGEGYIIKVTGKCTEDATIAAEIINISRIVVPDGEVRLDFKVVTGQDRASVILGFRRQPDLNCYEATVVPGLGEVDLIRGAATLGVRKDRGSVVSRDDWNTLAVRMRGSSLWMLVNNQLVLQTNDATYDSGTVMFALRRLGDLNDTLETAAVFRNLRVSSLATSDPQRVPTIQK